MDELYAVIVKGRILIIRVQKPFTEVRIMPSIKNIHIFLWAYDICQSLVGKGLSDYEKWLTVLWLSYYNVRLIDPTNVFANVHR